MLYLVKIGRISRRGNFETLCSFPVESKAGYHEVKKHYQKNYSGFEVAVTDIEQVPEKMDTSYISNVLVQYTEEEKEISGQYTVKKEEADALLKKLHEKIEKRYDALKYTDICFDDPIRLETKDGQTWINRLPIYPQVFIQHIGEGREL